MKRIILFSLLICSVLTAFLLSGCEDSLIFPTTTTTSTSTTTTLPVGWAVGTQANGYGTILNTTDGGSTWIRQGSSAQIPNVGMSAVSAVDANTAWAVGNNPSGGVILGTTDAGITWTEQATCEGGLGGVSFVGSRK